MHQSTHLTDTVMIVSDGTTRTHILIAQLLNTGRNVVVTGRLTAELVPYLDAGIHDHVWAVMADPREPAQITEVIERATDTMGPVIMVIDPAGQLTDVATADRLVA